MKTEILEDKCIDICLFQHKPVNMFDNDALTRFLRSCDQFMS